MSFLSVFHFFRLSHLACLLCIFSCSFAHCQDIHIVRGNGDYSPYEMTLNDELTGFHIELIRIVAKQLNLNPVFESLPWKRALTMVEKGFADAVTYAGKNTRRERYLIFIPGNELSWAVFGLVVLDTRKTSIRFRGSDISSLRPYKIGQLLGYSYGSEFDSSALKRSFFNESDQLIGMLRTKRIDIAIVNQEEFENKKYNEDLSKLRVSVVDNLIGTGNFIAFSKKLNHQALATRFSKAMLKFKNTPEFNKLQKKYSARYK